MNVRSKSEYEKIGNFLAKNIINSKIKSGKMVKSENVNTEFIFEVKPEDDKEYHPMIIATLK